MLLKNILPSSIVFIRQATGMSQKMSILQNFQNLSWCKPDWCFPSMSKETVELLRQCSELPATELSVELEEVIEKSKAFPIPFPIDTIRLHTLKESRPVEKLKGNIESTYPLLHERVLLLMTHFLIYKREFGSSIEKAFYKDMTVIELIDRILKKRAVNFMGPSDQYLLITGETGKEGWEAVGTLQQRPPLVLEQCLSYDEMKLAAWLYVSGRTECINSGARHNAGRPDEDMQQDAVIIGAIGPRFERKGRMDYEDILITEEQNTEDNGFGEEVTPTTCLNVLRTTYVRNHSSARHMWRQMWAEFYQVHSYTYEELTSYVNIQHHSDEEKRYTERYVKLPQNNYIFDNEVYYKRIAVLVESVLLEAEHRAAEQERDAFVNVIGCGLGVWRVSPHQNDVYVLAVLERVRALLRAGALRRVTDVNLAYIATSATLAEMFTSSTESSEESPSVRRIFFESKKHPRGGVSVQAQNRDPAARLPPAHAHKLLVLTYPWDCNAHPGNEFWVGSLTGSGDPAAACSTQVSELHNAHINPALCARRTRVVTRDGLRDLAEYCAHASL